MTDPQQPQPSEEEVRAALEEQLRQLTVDDMLLEQRQQGKHAEQLGPLRDALARLQMAYAQTAGQQEPASEKPQEPPQEGNKDEPGPAQKSGKLWVPGQ